MSNNYKILVLHSTSRLGSSGSPDILRVQYVSLLDNGLQHDFSITRLQDGKFSLVHFNDARQKDKHYSTFRRAYKGMHCILRRLAKSMEVA